MSKYYSSSIAFGANQTKTEKVVVNQNKIGDVTTDAVSGALTVDEVPTLNSLNPVSSDGVARAVIQAGAELPTRGSEDTGKVLTVANSDGDLEWDEPLTVDQTYDASSENAQSGVAVAEAIASIPSTSYTAGYGIDITNGEISDKAITPADKQINVLGKNNVPNMTLNLVNPTSVPTFATISTIPIVDYGNFILWRSDELSTTNYPGLDNGSAVTLYLNIPSDVVLTGNYSGATLSSTEGIWVNDTYNRNRANITSSIIDSSNILKIQAGRFALTMNMSQVYGYAYARLSLSVYSWLESGGTQVALDVADKTLIAEAMANWTFEWPKTGVGHYEMDITAIPASTSADENKVLTVNSSGNAEWATVALGTVQSIQQVNALPASPDANTLYLIPET